MVERTFLTALGAIDRTVMRSVYRTARNVGADDAMATDLATGAGLTKDEGQDMSKLITIIVEKYQILTEYMPEFSLGVILIGYGGRVAFTLGKLRAIGKEAEERRKKEKANVTPSPAD